MAVSNRRAMAVSAIIPISVSRPLADTRLSIHPSLRQNAPGDLSRIKENTMKLRVILVCTLLLLVAFPTFALPLCQECNQITLQCDDVPGAFERCKYDAFFHCYIAPFDRCSPTLTQSTVLADWKVASIVISRPAPASDTATAAAPAAVVTTAMPPTVDLK
jgi:hypothetical protein